MRQAGRRSPVSGTTFADDCTILTLPIHRPHHKVWAARQARAALWASTMKQIQ